MREPKCSSHWWTSSGTRRKPDVETLTVRCTCTNRDLPSRLPFGNENGDFDLESGAAIKRIVSLRKPTSSVAPSAAARRCNGV